MSNPKNGVNLEDLILLIEEKVIWHQEAASDFRSLPVNMRLDVLQQLVRMTINPRVGKELEDKHGFDLRGYRAMYFANATRRIVYSVEDDGRCKIWGIGPRAGFAIYSTVARRIKS
ncbi:MAG: type II toxin-antitoxin system RelE family toxin [Bacillota bacterium]